MKETEFDRSKCFTFFESYYTTGQLIEELKGKEVAYEYYKAIMEYALYKKPIEDKELLLYVGKTLLETIDSSQEKRSRAFGENMTVTRSILETVRDHPEYSQNQVAQELQISKGKVNKVLTKYRAGGYADDVDFNLIINKVEYTPTGTVVNGTGTNYNNNYNNNNNSTDRYRDHQRDRLDGLVAGSLVEVAGAPNVVASAPNSADAARLRLPDDLPEDIKNIKFEAKIDDKSMLEVMDRDYRECLDDGWETHEDIRDKLIEKFTTGFYCGDNDKVTAYAEFLMKHYTKRN